MRLCKWLLWKHEPVRPPPGLPLYSQGPEKRHVREQPPTEPPQGRGAANSSRASQHQHNPNPRWAKHGCFMQQKGSSWRSSVSCTNCEVAQFQLPVGHNFANLKTNTSRTWKELYFKSEVIPLTKYERPSTRDACYLVQLWGMLLAMPAYTSPNDITCIYDNSYERSAPSWLTSI